MGSSASVANICTMSSPPPPSTTSFISPPEMYNPEQKEMVRLRFSGKKLADLDFFSKSDPFLELSRPARQGYNFTTVRKTETINNNLNPNWKVLYIPLSDLCDRDFDMKLKIDVYDEDNTTVELIGEVCLSLNDLLSMANSQTPAQLFEGHKRDKSRGDLYVKECVVENYSHLPSQPDDRKASMASVTSQQVDRRYSMMSQSDDRRYSMMSQPDDRRTSMMSQSENLVDGSRRSSLMSQSGELVTPYNPHQANLNYSNQAFAGSYLNNNPAIPPAATYSNPAASQGYPPFHPGYTSAPSPGYAAAATVPSGDLGDSPRYPPAHQQFQPPNFPGTSGQPPAYNTSGQPPAYNTSGQPPAYNTSGQPPAYNTSGQPPAYNTSGQPPAYNTSGQPPAVTSGQPPAVTSGQPPAYNIPVPSHDQHYIPNYNVHPGGPPGPTYPTPPASTNDLPPGSTNPIPPVSTYPTQSNSLYPQLP